MKVVAAFLLLMTFVLTAKGLSYELPTVPSFKKMLGWKPKPDRTLEVAFPGVSFRYEILAWQPAPNCQAVSKMRNGRELRWVTHAGWYAHEYLTKNKPVMFKKEGETVWYWLNIKTFKEDR